MKTLVLLGVVMMFSGCGASQKQLKDMDIMLTQVIDLPCDQVKQAAIMLREEIRKKIDK